MEGLTDDTKVQAPPPAASAEGRWRGVAWRLRGWQLQCIAAAAMSPAATLALLHSRLCAAVTRAIAGTRRHLFFFFGNKQ